MKEYHRTINLVFVAELQKRRETVSVVAIFPRNM